MSRSDRKIKFRKRGLSTYSTKGHENEGCYRVNITDSGQITKQYGLFDGAWHSETELDPCTVFNSDIEMFENPRTFLNAKRHGGHGSSCSGAEGVVADLCLEHRLLAFLLKRSLLSRISGLV